jgi:hypothetical protein
MVGGDGVFDAPELRDWWDVARSALARLARSSSRIDLIDDGPVPAIAVRGANGIVPVATRHPFWRDEGPVVAPLIDAARQAFGPNMRWIDTFELSRRPFVVIARHMR